MMFRFKAEYIQLEKDGESSSEEDRIPEDKYRIFSLKQILCNPSLLGETGELIVRLTNSN